MPRLLGTLRYIVPSFPLLVAPQHWFAGNGGLFRVVYFAEVCRTHRDIGLDLDLDLARDLDVARDVGLGLGLDIDARIGRRLDRVREARFLEFVAIFFPFLPYLRTLFFLKKRRPAARYAPTLPPGFGNENGSRYPL